MQYVLFVTDVLLGKDVLFVIDVLLVKDGGGLDRVYPRWICLNYSCLKSDKDCQVMIG